MDERVPYGSYLKRVECTMESTNVNSSIITQMRSDMRIKIPLRSEALCAEITFVRSFPRVCAQVDDEIGGG